MNLGPIQLIAFAFDSVNNSEGQIRRELDELRGRGISLGVWPSGEPTPRLIVEMGGRGRETFCTSPTHRCDAPS